MREFFENIFHAGTDGAFWGDPISFLLPYFTALTRIALPVLAIIVVVRCALSLLRTKQDKETWAWLGLGDGVRLPINHWENIIGRGNKADISLPFPEISRNHAALIRNEAGCWRLIDIAQKGNLLVNGEAIEGEITLHEGDVISLAGNELIFANITADEDEQQRSQRTVPGKKIRPFRTLLWLSLFIIVLASQLAMAQYQSGHSLAILLGFGWLIALIWGAWIFSRSLRRQGFEIETMAFFLTSLGLAVISSGAPEEIFKQCLAISIGVVGFFVLGLIMRDMKRIKALRWPAAGAALAMMGYVLLFGEEIHGAQNWITIFNFSLQPSELVKVLFIFAGAATLDRLFMRRNLYAFIVLSAAIVGCLALMSDFGTAIIFFVTYLVIAFLRSGDLATIGLSVGGAVSAVVLVLTAKPYVADRFATWGHAWEFAATSGYQQTRAMTVMSSGGMFGMGGGEGWLKQVAASDTDLVFAFVSEEWGMIIGFLALAALVIIALFALRSAGNARSTYYIIAACGTAALLLFQTILNVGGSLDLLPLTGVTFPFISNGGTSMMSCWCLMAFLKAIDTRQNASFALSLPNRRKMRKQEQLRQSELLPLDELFDDNAEDISRNSGEIELQTSAVAADLARELDAFARQQREAEIKAKAADLMREQAAASVAAAEQRNTREQRQEQKFVFSKPEDMPDEELALREQWHKKAEQPSDQENPPTTKTEEESPFARPFPSNPFATGFSSKKDKREKRKGGKKSK